jgi:hypothetical protein
VTVPASSRCFRIRTCHERTTLGHRGDPLQEADALAYLGKYSYGDRKAALQLEAVGSSLKHNIERWELGACLGDDSS